MALLLATLATELEALVPTSSELTGRQRLATAFGNYMHGAVSNGVGITTSRVDTVAVPAMRDAMAFSLPGTAAAAAATIVAGINAFWATMVASPAAFFTGATAITPPPYTSLAAALESTLASNIGLSLEDAATEIATDIQVTTDNIGTATFPGPVVAPIT